MVSGISPHRDRIIWGCQDEKYPLWKSYLSCFTYYDTINRNRAQPVGAEWLSHSNLKNNPLPSLIQLLYSSISPETETEIVFYPPFDGLIAVLRTSYWPSL
jgi:hypothetical protein